jgi:ABC-2 type transport system permease protein
MMLGALRGDRAHVTRMIVGLVLLVAATVAAALAIRTLSSTSAATASTVLVFAGSAVTLGFFLAPLVTGAPDPLDPRRFGVLGLSSRPLSVILAVAGLLSVPSLVVIVLAAFAAVVWTDHGASPLIAVVSAICGVLTCALAARVGMAIAALTLRERRSRELSGVFLLAILVVVVPVVVFLASLEWRGEVPVQLREAVGVLAVTPAGAAWALPAESASDLAWLTPVVAIVTIVGLAAAWFALVRRSLTTTERPVTVRERGGLGWFAVAPGTPGGAIAARSLIYWLRDRRYLVNVVIVPVAAAIAAVPLLVAGVPLEIVALVPVPIVALLFGWMPHNDLAYDSTAVWMHLASGIRGVSDRVGRLVPILLIGIPVLAVAIPVAIAVHGRWAMLPALVGVCASLFLSGLGFSSIASAAAPYAVTRPGDSPFQQPQRASSGVLSQGLVLLGAIAASAPSLWWGWLALTADVSYAMASMWAGITAGVVILAIGVAIGSAVFERRGSRLMEFAEST